MAENKDNKNTASNTMHLRIVSAEKYIFSDYVRSVSVQGVLGGLGVYPCHSPLLTFINSLPPINSSNVVYVDKDGNKNLVNVYGGVLEVQPKSVTVLVDTAIRGEDIDESLALESKRQAEEKLAKSSRDQDYTAALAELTRALSKLQAVELTRKLGKH